MVQISSPNSISQDIISELERFFPMANTIFNITDFRRLDHSLQTRYAQDVNNIYIVDRAVVDGFINGGYEEINRFIIGGQRIEFPMIKSIAFDSMMEGTDPEIVTLRDDDGRYVAQRYKNIIALSIPFENLTIDAVKKIFEGIGYHRMNSEEYITQKMKALILKGRENALSDTKKRMEKAEEGMHNAYTSWLSQYQAQCNLQRELEGIAKYDVDKEKNLTLELKRLFRSRYIESVEMHGNNLVVVTKPLSIGIWNIGQYTVNYILGEAYPSMHRFSVPEHDGPIPVENLSKFASVSNPATHCNYEGMPCSGNYSDMLKAFWMSDMLTGFNSAVKFIKSYSKSSGPYTEFENWLTTMGYFGDAVILAKNGKVETVDNGVLYMRNNSTVALTDDNLKAMGCTGKPTKPDEWEKLLIGTEAMNREGLAHSLEYIDTTVV